MIKVEMLIMVRCLAYDGRVVKPEIKSEIGNYLEHNGDVTDYEIRTFEEEQKVVEQ